MSKSRIQDIVTKKSRENPGAGVRPEYRQNQIRTGKGKVAFGIIVFLLAITLSVKVIDVFAKATIQVVLHKETINVDTILKSGKMDKADLPLEIMQLDMTERKTAKATGVENVEKKASGRIVVYNEFSSAPQKLIATTRFETPDGKIYRIKDAVTVPGAGSVEATVYADQPGEEYNIDLTDFTIPGFKGNFLHIFLYSG